MAEFEGALQATGLRFAIVAARFNGFITDRLLAGALDALKRTGADLTQTDTFRIPGAWEFPVMAKAVIATGRYDALICLGAVIRGETPHFDYVAGESARGLARLAAESGIPIAFGILTTNTVDQAVDRSGAKSGNKGFDAAMTAIEMAQLLRRLRESNS